MQIVSIGDNFPKMSNPVFCKKIWKLFQNVVCWKFYPALLLKYEIEADNSQKKKNIYIYIYILFLEKIRLGIACELSARWQMIHIKKIMLIFFFFFKFEKKNYQNIIFYSCD